MERQEIIRDVHKQIENLARLHVQYGLYHTDGFRAHKEQIRQSIRENRVDVKKELDHDARLIYKRYFD